MRVYECNTDNFLVRISDVDGELLEMLMAFATNVTKAPSKTAIADWKNKKCKLQFNAESQKWLKIPFDNELLFNRILKAIDREISLQIRNGSFTFNGIVFYTDDKSQLKWSEIAAKLSMNLIEFPFDIKGSGDNYLTINNINDFSAFYKKFSEEREKIRQTGRLFKYDEEKMAINAMEDYQWRDIDEKGQILDKIHELFESVLHPVVEEGTSENDNA